MRESLIEKNATKWAKDNGWLSYKFTSPNNRAVPDRLYIKDGQVVFFEFKAPDEEPTKLQGRVIRKMRDHGATVHIIDSVEDFKHAMS